MKIKTQIVTIAALASGVLALAGPAAAGGSLSGYRDAHERGGALTPAQAAVASFYANERGGAMTPAQAAVAFFYANERSTMTQSGGPAAIDFFNANERSTMAESAGPAAIAYFDANERATMTQPDAAPLTEVRVSDTSGFDWGTAALGASSAVILALLIGVSLILARHSRGRPLAR